MSRNEIVSYTNHKRASVEGGSIKLLNASEIEEEDQEVLQRDTENPNYYQDLADANRSKAKDRLKRKGYK